MIRRRNVSVVLLFGCVGFAVLVGCMPFSFSFHFITPKKAESTTTATYALPEGAGVKVINEVGTTKVTVDPNAAEMTLEVKRIAMANTQEDANSLLAEMQVTVTEPNDANEVLLIEAKRPASATVNGGEFNWSVSGDELNISAIAATVKVAQYRIAITLPSGHGVQVEQQVGHIRTTGLDTPATLRSKAGSIRSLGATTAVTGRTEAGSIVMENHTGSLDLMAEAGSIDVEILALAPTDAVKCLTQSGSIVLELPRNVNALLKALARWGHIDFWAGEFDSASDVTDTRSFVEATLGTGGATVDLETQVGSIGIRAD